MKKLLAVILAALTLAGSLASAAFAEESLYRDVKTTRWSYGAIVYASEKGYMNGTGGGSFTPAGAMTRAMVATVLWRMEKEPAVEFENAFPDVPAGKWYSDAVIWAKNAGVVKGLEDGRFAPDGKITREELVTMLYRFCDMKAVVVDGRGDLSPFADRDKIHGYAQGAVSWAVDAGLISGMTATTLSPRGGATREQFATILKRFDEADFEYVLQYNEPVPISEYTEGDYPLVTDADIYVATDGDDSGKGTFDDPYATFARAAEAVRSLKETKGGDITVAFKAGNYGPLSLELTSADSAPDGGRITYCAYGEGDVTFDNGVVLRAAEFEPISDGERSMFAEKAADNIKKIDLFSRLGEDEPYDLSLTVFAGDTICTPARFPNKYPDGTDNLLQAGYISDESHVRVTMSLMKNHMSRLHTTDNVCLYGFINFGWHKDLFRVGEYDAETGDCLITNIEDTYNGYLRQMDEFASDFYNRMCIYNASEELDAPGEYWVDQSTGIMYVYDFGADYHFGLGSTMIKMDHADGITFRGLTFTNTADKFIDGDYTHDLEIDRCVFTYAGGDEVISMERTDKGREMNFTLRDSEIGCVNGAAVNVYGKYMNDDFLTWDTGVYIDNNYIHDVGMFLEGACVSTNYCSKVRITHNLFRKSSREGVNHGAAYDLIVEYNVFDRMMQNSSDGGAVYGSNWHDEMGDVFVRYNLFLNTGAGGYSCYLDGSNGSEVYGNLFWQSYGVMLHDTRTNFVHDNVSIRGLCAGLTASPCENPGDDTFKAYLNAWVNEMNYLNSYPVLKAGIIEKWGWIGEVSLDPADMYDPKFILIPRNVVTGNISVTPEGKDAVECLWDRETEFSTVENNVGYTEDENPGFVNPTLGDYRVKEGAGCPDVRFEKIGRY